MNRHAKNHHVTSGQVLPIDKFGNDEADELGVLGAKSHGIHARFFCINKDRRLTQANAIDRIMLNILAARKIAERELGDDRWTSSMPLCIAHPRSGEG